MNQEIERKFLVDLKKLGALEDGQAIKQGFIETTSDAEVRIRLKGEKAFITIKSKNKGAVRTEFEYPIPVEDAAPLMTAFCTGPLIEKTRYFITHADYLWEVDIFHGDNAGLAMAEVELSDEHEAVTLPDWTTEEVTHDRRYYNANLFVHPFSTWNKTE